MCTHTDRRLSGRHSKKELSASQGGRPKGRLALKIPLGASLSSSVWGCHHFSAMRAQRYSQSHQGPQPLTWVYRKHSLPWAQLSAASGLFLGRRGLVVLKLWCASVTWQVSDGTDGWATPLVPHSVGLGWGLRVHVSNKLPWDADAASPGINPGRGRQSFQGRMAEMSQRMLKETQAECDERGQAWMSWPKRAQRVLGKAGQWFQKPQGEGGRGMQTKWQDHPTDRVQAHLGEECPQTAQKILTCFQICEYSWGLHNLYT